MRPALTAFALGAAAFGTLTLLVAAAAAVLADASGREAFAVAFAGVDVIRFERGARGTSTTIGPGIAAIALAGGAANAAAAAVLHALRKRST